MAGVEILAVEQPPPMREILDDAHIDRPTVHVVKGAELVSVIGWTIAGASRAVAVEIAYRNRILAVAPVDVPRHDVEVSHPGAEGVSGFQRNIDVSDLAPEFELTLRAILEDGGRVALGSVKVRHGDAAAPEPAGDAGADHEPESPSAAQARLEGEIDRLIAAGLDGREPPPSLDPGFFDRLVLTGRRVLLIGTGLGDLARDARARGAGVVDVLEPDSARAKVERMITARRDVNRVFFFDVDIADPATYAGGYGLALVPWSVEDIEPALPHIAKSTKVLVTRLPVSRGKVAVPASLQKAFPYHETLGVAASSNGGNGRKKSVMVALAADPDTLTRLLRAAGETADAASDPVRTAGAT